MHYIIQDAYSGYIWGDTRDHSTAPESILDACRAIDQSIGEDRTYSEVSRLSGDTGYIVYRVEGDAMSGFDDGQDPEYIEAVEQNCPVVGYVEWAA